MHIKDVSVTNPRNVVVQIPGFVANKWGVNTDTKLGVYYDEKIGAVVIRPNNLQARGRDNKKV